MRPVRRPAGGAPRTDPSRPPGPLMPSDLRPAHRERRLVIYRPSSTAVTGAPGSGQGIWIRELMSAKPTGKAPAGNLGNGVERSLVRARSRPRDRLVERNGRPSMGQKILAPRAPRTSSPAWNWTIGRGVAACARDRLAAILNAIALMFVANSVIWSLPVSPPFDRGPLCASTACT